MFKLGGESREIKTPENTPIIKKKLRKGVLAEANNDGTIYVDPSLKKNSKKYRKTIAHELQHMNDMESGRANYGDNHVEWEGKIYPRKNGYIQGPNGCLPEGDPKHPWEAVALKAEKKVK
jgi:ribosomal protein S17